MLLLSQAPGGALSARRCPTAASSTLAPLWKPNHAHKFSKSKPSFPNRNPRKPPSLTLANAADGDQGAPSSPPFPADEPVLVGGDDMPLEGVIQFDKPSSPSKLEIWGKVALLAGGDVLFLLLFSAIGRFSHGFPVLDFDTIRTADPFIAVVFWDFFRVVSECLLSWRIQRRRERRKWFDKSHSCCCQVMGSRDSVRSGHQDCNLGSYSTNWLYTGYNG